MVTPSPTWGGMQWHSLQHFSEWIYHPLGCNRTLPNNAWIPVWEGGFLYPFPKDAITKYTKPGGLNNRIYHIRVPEAGSPKWPCQWAWLLLRAERESVPCVWGFAGSWASRSITPVSTFIYAVLPVFMLVSKFPLLIYDTVILVQGALYSSIALS